MRTAPDGRGVISAIELPRVQDKPALFSTFLMWLLADLFEDLPEVGDVDKPKLVFFFDEAHLLFNGAEGLPRRGHPDRPADPLQGRRHLLRDPEPQGRARRRARPAGQPGAARAARLHPRGRQGLADRLDLPEARRTTTSRRPHRPGHRRGDGHRAVRARRADAGRVDDAALAALADGPAGPGGAAAGGGRLAAAGQYGTAGRPGVRVRAAGLAAGPSARSRPAGTGTRAAPRRRTGTRNDARSSGDGDDGGGAGETVAKVLGSPVFKSFARSAASALGREITRGILGTRSRRR